MSFASQVKAELCRQLPRKKCCAVAMAYGALLYCNTFDQREIRLVTASEDFAAILPKLFRRAFDLSFDEQPEPGAGGKRRFLIRDAEKIRAVFRAFDMEPEDTLALHINLGILENDCCRASFVRGAFLAGGSVTDPMKSYHLELVTAHGNVGRELGSLLFELGFEAGQAKRGANQVTYFKQSEAIADFLTAIGAPVAALDVMSAKVERDMRNEINRKVNCDTANADKTVAAAQEQLEAIRAIEREYGLDGLPEGLQQAALLRIANPAASLADLAQLSYPAVTKSCLGHRLKKLVELGKRAGGEN